MPTPDLGPVLGPVGNMKELWAQDTHQDRTARSQHSQESRGNSEGGEWGEGLEGVEFDGVNQNSPFTASPAEGGHVHSLVRGPG